MSRKEFVRYECDMCPAVLDEWTIGAGRDWRLVYIVKPGHQVTHGDEHLLCPDCASDIADKLLGETS